jgi:hypothetical protein
MTRQHLRRVLSQQLERDSRRAPAIPLGRYGRAPPVTLAPYAVLLSASGSMPTRLQAWVLFFFDLLRVEARAAHGFGSRSTSIARSGVL